MLVLASRYAKSLQLNNSLNKEWFSATFVQVIYTNMEATYF